MSGYFSSTVIQLSGMGEFLQRGVTHSRHAPRKGAPVSPEARAVVIPGFLVPSKLSCLAPFAQEFATASGAETHILNDNGRGRTVQERAQRIADALTTDHQMDADVFYLLGQSRGGKPLSSLEKALRERGYTVAAVGYVTPQLGEDIQARELARAFRHDLTTTALDTALHPVRNRRRLLPRGHFVVNALSGLLLKTALGETPGEIIECTKKNPDNPNVRSRVVAIFGGNDGVAPYERLLAEGVSHADIQTACEAALRQEFPNAESVRAIIVPGEQHDLPITRPRKTARLVYAAMKAG